jgi:hypothetical protein
MSGGLENPGRHARAHSRSLTLGCRTEQSWNALDIERILSHYTDDFEMRSPIIIEPMGIARARSRAGWRSTASLSDESRTLAFHAHFGQKR